MAVGKRKARLRYLTSAPTRFSAAPTSTPIVSQRAARRSRATEIIDRSERLLHLERPPGVGEDDDPVAREQHVVAVREDRLPLADDRADERPRHGQVAEAPVHQPALRPDGHVEDLVAVA